MAACANPTQLMSSLIPTFSAVIAALHLTVGIEVIYIYSYIYTTWIYVHLFMIVLWCQGGSFHHRISCGVPKPSDIELKHLWPLVDFKQVAVKLSPAVGLYFYMFPNR